MFLAERSLKKSFFWLAVVPIFGLVAVQRVHQADIAFGDDFGDRQTVAAVAHGDLCGETQVTVDKRIGGIAVAGIAPAFCEFVLMVLFEHCKAPDVVKIAVTASLLYERRFAPNWSGEATELSLNAHVDCSVLENSILFAVPNLSGPLDDKQSARRSH